MPSRHCNLSSTAALTPASRLLQTTGCAGKEPHQQAEETLPLSEELHALETERARLSLVEEKLMDVLQLLQQLRDLVSGNSCVAEEHCSLLGGKKTDMQQRLLYF